MKSTLIFDLYIPACVGQNGIGRLLLAQHAEEALHCFASAARSPSHMVAEAACLVVAEAVARWERSVVEPHVATVILPAIFPLLSDTRWPVRDAAAGSVGEMYYLHCFVCRGLSTVCCDLLNFTVLHRFFQHPVLSGDRGSTEAYRIIDCSNIEEC